MDRKEIIAEAERIIWQADTAEKHGEDWELTVRKELGKNIVWHREVISDTIDDICRRRALPGDGFKWDE